MEVRIITTAENPVRKSDNPQIALKKKDAIPDKSKEWHLLLPQIRHEGGYETHFP